MATRDDILAELGLAPRWQLRVPVAANVAQAPGPVIEIEPVRPASIPPSTPDPSPPAMPDAGDRAARIARLEWQDFDADVAACTACGLCKSRRKTVPGVGDRTADWLFVGEAPGSEEDARGEPFVGQAGRLLDNMLAALGLGRHRDVYIANVLKCRLPTNRTPEPLEVDACAPYLERQIAPLSPKLIVALGRSAASLLLGTDATIASLRGRVHRRNGIPLIVTYHPAYLLRNLTDKSKAWEDLLLARSTMRSVA